MQPLRIKQGAYTVSGKRLQIAQKQAQYQFNNDIHIEETHMLGLQLHRSHKGVLRN